MATNLKTGMILEYHHPQFTSFKLSLLKRDKNCDTTHKDCGHCTNETWIGMIIWTDSSTAGIPHHDLFFIARFCVGSDRFTVVKE